MGKRRARLGAAVMDGQVMAIGGVGVSTIEALTLSGVSSAWKVMRWGVASDAKYSNLYTFTNLSASMGAFCLLGRSEPPHLWGYNPVCKVTPAILHGVVSPSYTGLYPHKTSNPKP